MPTPDPLPSQLKHFSFYGPKGGQGTSTAAAVFALFASRLGCSVTLRAEDQGAMARHLAIRARDGAVPTDVTPSLELASLTAAVPASRVVVDDLARGDAQRPSPATATCIMVIRPCYLAIAAAIDALHGQPPPDSLLVVSEPDRTLGPSEVADALGSPIATVVALDPSVARMIDAGLLVDVIAGRGRVPRSLRPLLDLTARCLDRVQGPEAGQHGGGNDDKS